MTIEEIKWKDGSASYRCSGCGERFDTKPFLYGGPRTEGKRGLDLSGKMTRSAVFAAGDMANIQKPGMHQTHVPSTKTIPVLMHLDKDHTTLRGNFYKADKLSRTGKTVLLLSGSGDTLANYLGSVVDLYLSLIKVNVLAVDYRGFGDNQGTPGSRGTYTDAAAMLSYLTSSKNTGGRGAAISTVFVHGYSLGSGPATELALRNGGIAGLILHCPFTSAGDMAQEGIGLGPLGWVAKKITACGHAYDNYKKIVNVTCPIMIITGNSDGMQPHGKRLANRVKQRCLEDTYNGGHTDVSRIFSSQNLKSFINRQGNSRWVNSPLAV